MFKIKKQINVELFIILTYIIIDLVQVLVIINTHILVGDFFPWRVQISNIEIILLFLFQCLLYSFIYKIYISFIKKKRLIRSSLNLSMPIYRFIDYLFMLLLLLNIIFEIAHITVPAGKYEQSLISFVIHLIDIGVFFSVYYFLNRNKNNKIIYATNIIIYIFLQLAKGWSGIFLQIFLYELYFRSKGKINLKFILILPLLFVVGTFLYQYIYPLKIALRTGEDIFNIKPITFDISASLLVSRLSMMGNLIAIFQYKNDILQLLNNMYPSNFEILKFIRVLIPSFISIELFPYNIFLYGTLGNILWLFKLGSTFVPSNEIYGFGPTLLGTSYLLLLRNPIELILFYLFTVFVVIYIKILLDSFGSKDIYFPFFLNLVYFVHEAGETQTAFSGEFFSLTSLLFVILLAKAILYITKSKARI